MKAQQAFDEAYALSKSYTEESLEGAGALKGQDGKSAYQIAVDNGFVGSEADWLDSLKGKNGLDGNDGFSPKIEPNPDNTDKVYKLDITTADDTFTTPNLRGKDGSGSGGTDDYEDLENLPSIGGVELKGNKTLEDFNIQPKGDYSLVSETGYDLGLSIDESTYVMTFELKNKEGESLATKTIDFPIESMVVSASYSNGQLILTLQNGQTLDPIDISDIVGGLVNDAFTIAGIDMKDDITVLELATALGLNDLEDRVSSNEDNISDLENSVETLESTVAWLDKRAVVSAWGTVTKHWYKIASIYAKRGSTDSRISFKVSCSFQSWKYFGILTASFRVQQGNIQHVELMWEYARENIKLDNFVLAYRQRENDGVDVELWVKLNTHVYEGWVFEVLEEGDEYDHTETLWTLYSKIKSDGDAEEIPSEFTQIPSTLMTLANPVEGMAFKDDLPAYDSNSKILTANAFYVGRPSSWHTKYGDGYIDSNNVLYTIEIDGDGDDIETNYGFGIYEFYPDRNLPSLGTSYGKWSQLYANNGTIQTSDVNAKKNIEKLSLDKAKSLLMLLESATYKMIDGTSGRTHWGMLSNDYLGEDGKVKILGIEGVLNKLGWETEDFAGFIKSPKVRRITEDENGNPLKEPIEEVIEDEYDYSLRYDEFISPMIRVIQDQEERINSLESEVAELKAMVQQLLNR